MLEVAGGIGCLGGKGDQSCRRMPVARLQLMPVFELGNLSETRLVSIEYPMIERASQMVGP